MITRPLSLISPDRPRARVRLLLKGIATQLAGLVLALGCGPLGAEAVTERMMSGTAACEAQQAADWITTQFPNAPSHSGVFEGRLEAETPVVLKHAQVSQARYGVSIHERVPPLDPRIALIDVSISDLRSANAFGGGIKTHSGSPGVELFLVNVTINPNWPHWVSYAKTNYDGLVLDAAAAIYAQNLTVNNWNADSAIDNKAEISQFVNLVISGPGHRPIRYWRPGPHFLVDADISREGTGPLLWFRHCEATTVYIYNSVFNGEPRVTGPMVQCDEGTAPNLVYLPEDPVKKGKMSSMFRRCPKG
ncbi:hypothetical protein [Pseudoruegeria sp. SHC-113]|uniref:hypothetical protein n=1 Tax=Pseudoruegeria sp. SHC-113 TaxID=2855439 RepID=UPI0021BA574D|nr:hypothetical protein [Pseudoruegeria sp. SHC-113]MCT8158636.1 hypothetical protein [Pseudoruegeria sp. SHC-113]